MKYIMLVLVTVAFSCSAGQAVSLKPNAVIVCAGDSISTQYDAVPATLHSYPNALDAVLKLNGHPLSQVIPAGVPGDRSFMLLARFEKDVLSHQPDCIVILIGVNNLHFTDPVESYKADLQAMVDKTRVALPKTQILFVSPFLMAKTGETLVGPAFNPTHFKLLPNYIEGMREVASRNRCAFIDMHEEFQKAFEMLPPSYFCNESVHPYEKGRLLMAQRIAERMKFSKR